MSLSTHVLDTATGRPAAGVAVHYWVCGADGWQRLASARTDADGRVPRIASTLTPGLARLVFEIGGDGFFPEVAVTFRVTDPTEHHHVPLLLSPCAYTTYRGS
jgi:5-hydroxyisourate hydrolase